MGSPLRSQCARYDAGSDTHGGLRLPVGVSLHLKGHPIELFLEAGIVIDFRSGEGCSPLAPSSALCRSDEPVDLLAGMGFRDYFGRKR